MVIPIASKLTPDLEIHAPVYVDEILGVGSNKTIEKTIWNTKKLEEEKKFRFNRKKSKYMVMNTGREKEEPVCGEVKDRMIEMINEYKYLGIWFTQNNKLYKQLDENKSRMMIMLRNIRKIASSDSVGRKSAEVQRMLYESIVIPAITYNPEVITNLSAKEMEEIERLQKIALTELFQLPGSAPYWGILNETGMWTLKCRIIYKRLMLHRHLMISDNGRVAKAILLEQKKYEINDCLMSEMKSDAEELNVNLDALHEMKTKKSEMKKLLKMRIGGLMRREAEKKIATIKKLRFLKGSEFGEKEYNNYETLRC